MTPVYEVRTIHTKQVLKDFMAFRENVRNSRVTFRLVMLSVCSVTMAYLARSVNGLFYTFCILAVLFVGLAFARKPIGFQKLAKADANYQTQSEIHFIFGESEFHVENAGPEGIQKIKYGEVEFMYADDRNYYININNEDLHLIPKTDFTLGDATGFYDFMMHKTGKDFKPVKLTWAMKLDILKQAWAMRDQDQKKE